MIQPAKLNRLTFLVGLDGLRVLALCLVTFQHALSLLNHDEWTTYGSLYIGQFGVALFLAVSGFLAGESQHPPWEWLQQRLQRLYPAYWIAMTLSFVLTWWTEDKQFSSMQVLSQMCGIGFFTHVDNMVNTPTWFISLLLVCYLATFLARLLGKPLFLGACSALVLAVFVGFSSSAWLSAHYLTYSLSCCLAFARVSDRTKLIAMLSVALCTTAVLIQPAFFYPGLGILLFGIALRITYVPQLVRWVANVSYEYYLLHGIALMVMVRMLPATGTLAVCVGIILAAMAAPVLHVVVNRLNKRRFLKLNVAASAHPPDSSTVTVTTFDA